MISEKGHGSAVKTSLPRELYMAIVRLQASENLDWDEACVRAAGLLDQQGEKFKRAIELEAQRLYKSRFMSELNKARKSIEKQYYKLGYDEAMKIEHFSVPCSVCGEPVVFSSRDARWDEARRTLSEAFKNCRHTNCVRK